MYAMLALVAGADGHRAEHLVYSAESSDHAVELAEADGAMGINLCDVGVYRFHNTQEPLGRVFI